MPGRGRSQCNPLPVTLHHDQPLPGQQSLQRCGYRHASFHCAAGLSLRLIVGEQDLHASLSREPLERLRQFARRNIEFALLFLCLSRCGQDDQACACAQLQAKDKRAGRGKGT
ncbi:hypothetical protein [Pelagerythrobacter marensis]|uniref:hypothetical protein n=1 Tax=Pelagerythrobacter marensis TaxID=543877 RepID=UPI00069D76EA|nr:hypothetical protein [Pelagerythrobacter marensis]